ncbi:radical SAM protein [Prolixibacteraceae bacterium JC049]|nr:radical SAM protein [Prolixibacteraceae bacterium JC049]
MATFLFDKTIFGPVISRRLGVSLGVNLLPNDSKICSFDCIYCECGLNPKGDKTNSGLPSREQVAQLLEEKLKQMQAEKQLPDVITFAGNGEPTLHPDFEGVIDDTLALRDQFAPKARVAVLSNSTRLKNSNVVNALLKVDDNILKLDSAIPKTVEIMNCPNGHFSIEEVVKQLSQFNGQLIIQTMFLKGTYNNQPFDNTTDEEVTEWLRLLEIIRPEKVMIYSIARDTPIETLEKISSEKITEIAELARKKGFIVDATI